MVPFLAAQVLLFRPLFPRKHSSLFSIGLLYPFIIVHFHNVVLVEPNLETWGRQAIWHAVFGCSEVLLADHPDK